ncbi:MAG: molybdopterin-synthase adenylyltransferase MoeB [Pseudomonadota bacterium]|jgi:molybdopterin/thiamine biosynthesis adenylyltransferase
MDDDQLLRYSRHILLDDIGIEGQQRILNARALVIGLGGLGSPAALYLGTAGVGHLTLVDHDRVDLTNLQRQVAHTQARVGQYKVDSAKEALLAINPTLNITVLRERADARRLEELVAQADVVLDCSDNFATRQALNTACVRHHVPLVSGAAIRFDGQLAVYDSRQANSPCYACVFPPDTSLEETHCATMGVFAPLVGIIGSMQAAEALKLISGAGDAAVGRLLMLDGRSMQWSDIRLPRNLHCSICGLPG